MAKYLKKKRLYGLTSQLLADKKLPILKNCEYRFSHGAEWLVFGGTGDDYHHYRVSAQNNGGWLNIEEWGSVNGERTLIRSDIYSDLQDGKYRYHSVKQIGG